MGHKPWDRAWRRAGKARERNWARREMVDEARDDLYDMVQIAARLATDSGERYPLDEVIEELGLTQAEIDAAEERESEGIEPTSSFVLQARMVEFESPLPGARDVLDAAD